jgi:hypothetical protein
MQLVHEVGNRRDARGEAFGGELVAVDDEIDAAAAEAA